MQLCLYDVRCSLVELLQGGTGGLSVLRTFRLLRILKLVRFLPALRYQLFVMLKTMDNVATFFALLVLFIFIFRYLSLSLKLCHIKVLRKCFNHFTCNCVLSPILVIFLQFVQHFYVTTVLPSKPFFADLFYFARRIEV